MKATKKKGLVNLLLMLLLTALVIFTAFVGLDSNGYGNISNIRLGLDLAGGVSITYQSVTDNPSDSDMADTIYKLQQRAYTYSTESEVYKEGALRINVDIPNVDDADKILEDLGKPGSLKFTTEDGTEVLNGKHIEDASAGSYQDSVSQAVSFVVQLKLNSEGKALFAKATAENIGKKIYITYDGKTVSAPTVEEKIESDTCQITSIRSYEEADLLAKTIRIGSIPLELKEVRSNVVGAKLGEEAIKTSLIAGIVGFILVLLFMIVLYRIPGLAAGLALIFYVASIICTLSFFHITLTLAGIAGIILSIGMAVDANVVIFDRIKEEIAAGNSIHVSIKNGFAKAFSAVFDGNITTLIAAGVLFFVGTGTIRGFAQTLAIGIILSMFTSLVITRIILNALFNLGCQKESQYGKTKERASINFLGKKHIYILASVAIILVGVVAMGINGAKGNALNYSLEFIGGTATTVTLDKDMTLSEIQSEVVPKIAEVIKDTESNILTNKVEGGNQIMVKTKELTQEERVELKAMLVKEYKAVESEIECENISATMGKEMRRNAMIAVVISTIFMLVYILIRFQNMSFATGAVIPLINNVLILLTAYAVLRWAVGTTFIACMLTLVGYSINATIVIFDRIRENKQGLKYKYDEQYSVAVKEVINKSITQTLSRSINTTITTLIMVVCLAIIGVSAVKEFAYPLLVGLITGTYSSVFIAGAMYYIFEVVIKKGSKN